MLPRGPAASPEAVPKTYGAGGVLGMFFSGIGPAGAAIFTNPFDVAKVRMQLQGEAQSGGARAYSGSVDCIWKTFQSEGLAGTQRGLLASVLREGSKNFFRIGLFHPVLERLHDEHESSPPIWKRLIAGSISGAAGAILCNPIEIVKTRVQASSVASGAVGYQGYRYAGLTDAFRTIARKEGISGLWTGTSISTIRSILATSANMTVNSWSKEKVLHDPALAFLGLKPGALTDALCAILSGFACVAANNPADVVRTRLYNQPFKVIQGARVGEYYSGVVECCVRIVRDEGPLALYKGFTGHFMRTGPHYVLCFVFIGYLQRLAQAWKSQSNLAAWESEMQSAFQSHAVCSRGSGEDHGEARWDVRSLMSVLGSALEPDERNRKLSDRQYQVCDGGVPELVVVLCRITGHLAHRSALSLKLEYGKILTDASEHEFSGLASGQGSQGARDVRQGPASSFDV